MRAYTGVYKEKRANRAPGYSRTLGGVRSCSQGINAQ